MSYSKLPNELKLEIWGYALPKEATIHRLKIDMPSTDRGPDDQVMKVSPVKATKKDAPLWREFWNFSAVDITARAVAAPEKRLTVWQPDEAKANRLKALADSAKGDKARLRYTTKVTIDADRDVVHFKFTCDLFDPYLPRQLNQGLFTGIKRVAVDWKVITRGYKEFQPFQCFCSAGMQNRHPLCHYSMGQWLSYFKDVEVFYLVLKLTRKEINEKGMLRACERRFNAKYRKRLVDPMLRNTLRGWFERKLESMEKRKQLMQRPAAAVISQWNDHFRRAAKKKGLEIFHEGDTTYYEADPSSSSPLLRRTQIFHTLMRLKNLWQSDGYLAHCPEMQAKAKETKFKLLVYS